jgi:membrane protein implicated in regulation of membrane protease activity
MSLESFYLLCFFVGFLLAAVAFLFGALHLPHFHGPHARVGVRAGVRGGGHGGISPFNFGTLAAFLAWFGGTGFLLERYSAIWVILGLFLSVVSGLGGAAAVFWFLLKLAERDQPLDPADYEMIGVLGRVTSPIREGGTGELLYQRDGSRKAAPARSEDGDAIPRETEVIVTRFEKGIAYVRRFEEMSGGEY